MDCTIRLVAATFGVVTLPAIPAYLFLGPTTDSSGLLNCTRPLSLSTALCRHLNLSQILFNHFNLGLPILLLPSGLLSSTFLNNLLGIILSRYTTHSYIFCLKYVDIFTTLYTLSTLSTYKRKTDISDSKKLQYSPNNTVSQPESQY